MALRSLIMPVTGQWTFGLDSPARKHLVTLECFLVLPDKHQAALNVF
jgi:hypothetical protein